MFSVFPSHKPDSITTIYIFLGIINKLSLKSIPEDHCGVYSNPVPFFKGTKAYSAISPVRPEASSTQRPTECYIPNIASDC